MIQPPVDPLPGHHLAEFNWGILKHDWDDPRVAEFAEAVPRVNSIAQRSVGFVWMMGDEAMDAAQNDPTGPLGGNPRMASTLSVWESVATLHRFVTRTVHDRFMRRGGEWHESTSRPRMVLWWVPVGHRPDPHEAMARLDLLERGGAGPDAFDWAWLRGQGMVPAIE